MTGRPTRATADGRAYLDLQNLARRSARPTDELHRIYALEGFLARLAASQFADKLVLKGEHIGGPGDAGLDGLVRLDPLGLDVVTCKPSATPS